MKMLHRTGGRIAAIAILLAACAVVPDPAARPDTVAPAQRPASTKPVIYQLLPRLFGNRVEAHRAWGTREQNGVGKFEDIDAAALAGLRQLGTTHVWYTGVLHHAQVADYTAYGIAPDDPDVVKGRAGSPYAIRDYYDVDPDLAVDPARRLAEFRALVARTHAQGLRVLIDLVPNHVARRYDGAAAPAGVRAFGADDDPSVEYARHNNFYYLPGTRFEVPEMPAGWRPLGGAPHPLADGRFDEVPAKWTGNGARKARPDFDDWYETVRLNFGVRPDGSHDFPELPAALARAGNAAVLDYWRDADVPDTWRKFRAIADFWLDQGVDGFRYDMAELVPVAFWSYLNSHIKARRPDALLLAEVYDPARYRAYLDVGRMDLLYDKVGFYDALKPALQGKAGVAPLLQVQEQLADIDSRLLRFLENHDEQRLASPQFAGDPRRGLPAMLLAAALGRGPVLLYFGQEVGETGALACGFGQPSRTTLFDYCGVPAHQRWMNGGRFDGGALQPAEADLRAAYVRLLRFAASAPALQGDLLALHGAIEPAVPGDPLLVFARWSDGQRLLVAANLADRDLGPLAVTLPDTLLRSWQLADGEYLLRERLGSPASVHLQVAGGVGRVQLQPGPLAALVYELDPGTLP